MDAVTKQMLKVISHEFELAAITKLDLSDRGITLLGCVGDCVSIDILNLSSNNISVLYSLATLTNLSQLDLSNNRITSLEGLQTLEKLKVLNLAGNLLQSIDALWNISNLSELWSLTLKSKTLTNPLFNNCYTYRQQVTSILPAINILDGECVRGEDGEFFVTREELDANIKELENMGSQEVSYNSTEKWIPDEFWKSTNQPEDNTSISDIDAKITELLASCKSLSEKGKHVLHSETSSTK